MYELPQVLVIKLAIGNKYSCSNSLSEVWRVICVNIRLGMRLGMFCYFRFFFVRCVFNPLLPLSLRLLTSGTEGVLGSVIDFSTSSFSAIVDQSYLLKSV